MVRHLSPVFFFIRSPFFAFYKWKWYIHYQYLYSACRTWLHKWLAILWKKLSLFRYSPRIIYLPSVFSCVHPFLRFTKLWSSVRGLSSLIHCRCGCRKSVVEAFIDVCWHLISLTCSRSKLSRLAFMQCNAQIRLWSVVGWSYISDGRNYSVFS